jgi:hypothetical protein
MIPFAQAFGKFNGIKIVILARGIYGHNGVRL